MTTDSEIAAGPFTEEAPYPESCGSTDDHPAHKERQVLTRWDGARYYQWTECPGWETTHTVTVTDASGRVVGQQDVDLRGRLEYSGSTNDPLLTLLYEAKEAGEPRPTDDQLIFGIAASYVAPEVCPWDSDRCHEHLYELSAELEDEA